ncbi:GNAT family N-acetyltransferase [Streptosporangium sp. KLBMP 9127]|nr:GNAT family N-acetyltransferase [Streptosporangium sp. KLBMP 9127]
MTDDIATERLDLRPLLVEHAEEMAVVLSDPALHVYIGGRPATTDELRARYERMVEGSPDVRIIWRNWVIWCKEEARLVGYVQATIEGPTAEIAWVVGTPWQGRGFAKEAAGGLVGWLTGEKVDTVIAHIHPENLASAAVAASAGLVPTDQWHDGERRWSLAIR